MKEHQKIDQAASREAICNEADALAYIEEISRFYAVPEILLNEFPRWKRGLASAELAAIRGLRPWINEEQIAAAFNRLTDAYGVPGAHIQAEAVREFRA